MFEVIMMPVTPKMINADDLRLHKAEESQALVESGLVPARLSGPEFGRCTALRAHQLLTRKQTVQRYEALLLNQICASNLGC